MLHIKNIKFLSNVQTAMDAFDTPQVILKITIDESFFFPDATAKTKGNQSQWQEHAIPPIQLSQQQQEYLLTFIVYRNGILIGTAKTRIKHGQNIKEQNNIIYTDKTNNGIILYEGEWTNYAPGGSFVTWEQFVNFKNGNTAGGNKPIPKTTASQKRKEYVRKDSDQDCGGICACFKSRSKPPTRPPHRAQHRQEQYMAKDKTNYYAPSEVKINDAKKEIDRKPLMYTQKELGPQVAKNGENPHKNEAPRKLTYYSKTHHRSN